MRILIACVVVAGCGYHPGSFSGRSPYAGTRSTVGCLDLAIDRRADERGAVVLDYQFGNRCDRAAPVDLASVVVLARTREGREVQLAPYDPEQQIAALRIDGRLEGREVIAYPTDADVVQVCIDTGSLAHVAPAQWMCLGNRSSALAEVTP